MNDDSEGRQDEPEDAEHPEHYGEYSIFKENDEDSPETAKRDNPGTDEEDVKDEIADDTGAETRNPAAGGRDSEKEAVSPNLSNAVNDGEENDRRMAETFEEESFDEAGPEEELVAEDGFVSVEKSVETKGSDEAMDLEDTEDNVTSPDLIPAGTSGFDEVEKPDDGEAEATREHDEEEDRKKAEASEEQDRKKAKASEEEMLEEEMEEVKSIAEEELRQVLKTVDDRTTDFVLRLHRELEKLKQRRKELMSGTKTFEEGVQKDISERLKEITRDIEYEKERILKNKESDLNRIEKKIKGKEERLKKDAEEKEGFDKVKREADEARKAREKIEQDLHNLSPELRKLHEDEFYKWIEEAKIKENETNKLLEEAEAKVREIIQMRLTEYETDLKNDIMEIEDSSRADLANLEKSVAERKLKVQEELDRKINQRQMVLIQDNNALISETMNLIERLVDDLDKPAMKTIVQLILASVKTVAFIERKNYILKKEREEEKKKKRMRHYQDMIDIERRQLEKREAYLSREREGLMKELEEKSKKIIKKEMDYRVNLERNLEQRLQECAEDARCSAEELVKEEYEKRIEDMENDYRRKLVLYKKKLHQYKKQKDRPAPVPGTAPPAAAPDTFPCLNCKSQVIIPTKKRPVTVRCQKCRKEYTLRAPKRETIPARQAGTSSAPSPSLPELPDLEGLDEDRTMVTPPPPSELSATEDSNTRKITCQHCGKQYDVSVGHTKKISCSCGRKIRTK